MQILYFTQETGADWFQISVHTSSFKSMRNAASCQPCHICVMFRLLTMSGKAEVIITISPALVIYLMMSYNTSHCCLTSLLFVAVTGSGSAGA